MCRPGRRDMTTPDTSVLRYDAANDAHPASLPGVVELQNPG
ncbi:hypothetical protein [Kocuria marina]|nr:hypothetical protein [Kocuria marina]